MHPHEPTDRSPRQKSPARAALGAARGFCRLNEMVAKYQMRPSLSIENHKEEGRTDAAPETHRQNDRSLLSFCRSSIGVEARPAGSPAGVLAGADGADLMTRRQGEGASISEALADGTDRFGGFLRAQVMGEGGQ